MLDLQYRAGLRRMDATSTNQMATMIRTSKQNSSEARLIGFVDQLESRMMLAGDVLFDIADAGTTTPPEFDPAYVDYLRDFFHEHHGDDHDHHDHDHHDDDHHEDEHDDDHPILEVTPAEPSAAEGTIGESIVFDSYDLSQTFQLHSLADSDFTIYLDFDGHTTSGTFWNDNGDIVTPAFDIDGDATFSDTELARIQRVWARVAEDFAPFDVNVTTQDPGTDALRKSGAGDSEWGVRVVIGENTFFSPAGGVAYIGSFDWNSDTPAFVFNTSEVGVAEAVSHEVGHALGLRHDGVGSVTYYSGHGSGATSWAPIMGAGYYKSLTQWSQGEYHNADRFEDDLNIITTGNGFGYRADDFGNDQDNATELLVLGESEFATTYGIIGQNTDVDYFSFYAAAGEASINIDPLSYGANLDILAELYDSSGNLVAMSNPVDELHATFDVTLPVAAEYFLSVTGTGKGDPLDDGYTDYGSLGNFRIEGTVTPFDLDMASSILVHASGDMGTEQFDLQINGSTVATFDVGTEFSTFEYSAFGVTADQIRIVFRGDQFDAENGLDTNLHVDWVSIDGNVIETESSSVFSTGVLTEFGYEAGFGLGETLGTDGYFQFDATIAGADLQVDELNGLRQTTRSMTITLDNAENNPLVINLREGTMTTSRGFVEIPDTIRRIIAKGNNDNDQIFVVGADADSKALVREGLARIAGDGVTVIGRGFETVHSYASGGEDSLTLRGKRRASEQLESHAQRSILSSDAFDFYVYNYENIKTFAIGDGSSAEAVDHSGGQSSASPESLTSNNAEIPTQLSGHALLQSSQFDYQFNSLFETLFDLDDIENA